MYDPILYDPIRKETKSGIRLVRQWLERFGVDEDLDGLLTLSPGKNVIGENLDMPQRLRDWLFDIRLLRKIPLSYLVPDAALLPPESIRFFHVDLTWVDRVIDGVFSAASLGTVGWAIHVTILSMVRDTLDYDLQRLAKRKNSNSSWTPAQGMTGMLIRSELARRWPDMIVKGFEFDDEKSPVVPLLRSESISKDIYISLFAGEPGMIQIKEPFTGTRFGVEKDQGPVRPGQSGHSVDKRTEDGGPPVDEQGKPLDERVPIYLRGPLINNRIRTLNVTTLAKDVPNGENKPSSRMVALHLEQRPYVQEFKRRIDETRGSKNIKVKDGKAEAIPLSTGRLMRLDRLVARQEYLDKMEGED